MAGRQPAGDSALLTRLPGRTETAVCVGQLPACTAGISGGSVPAGGAGSCREPAGGGSGAAVPPGGAAQAVAEREPVEGPPWGHRGGKCGLWPPYLILPAYMTVMLRYVSHRLSSRCASVPVCSAFSDLVAFISQALSSLKELWLMGNLLKQLPDGIEGLQVRAEGEEREEKGGQRWPEGSRGRGCD